MNKIILTLSALAGFALFGQAEIKDATIEIWNKQCKKCHGETGAADTKLGEKLAIGDYTKVETLADKTDEQLFNETKDGVPDTKMNGYGKKLSDEEIHDLVAYMRSFAN